MSNYKLYIPIPLLFLLAILSILFLHLTSYNPNEKPNGFKRNIFSGAIELVNSEKFEKVIYPGTIMEDKIIFYSQTPGEFYETNANLKNVKRLYFNVEDSLKLSYPFSVIFDSSNAFIMALNAPAIITCDIKNNSYAIKKLNRRFNQCARISDNSYALRMFVKNNQGSNYVLGKFNSITLDEKWNGNVLDHMHDGGFNSDGMLHYNDSLKCLIYLMYYRNEIYSLDTNLNLIARNNTIDTFTTSNLKIIGDSQKGFTLGAPPRIINRYSCLWGRKLFVCSNIKSDNETHQEFSSQNVIDVYQLPEANYLGSFYLPFHNGIPATDFKVLKNNIIVAYKNEIEVYKLKL
jgi:hypothetical protein